MATTPAPVPASALEGLGIRRATGGDLQVVVETLATGFYDGDFAHWLIADPAHRAAAYTPYFQIIAEHALDQGWVEITDDGHAVALWHMIRIEPRHEPQPHDYAQRLAAAVGPDALPRFEALDSAMESQHPASRHYYLGHLAVRPHRRGQGLGSALLANHHTHLDNRQIPAYLEATGHRNQALYAQHGYQPMPTYRITDNGPLVRPMWRNPQPATTSG